MPVDAARVAETGSTMSVPAGTCVLILVENLSVPFDRRVWQESRSLVRVGYNVFVVCPKGKNQDSSPYDYIEGVHIFRYDLTPAHGGPTGYWREYVSALASTARLVQRISRRWRFDVVHACNPPDLLLFVGASLKAAHGAALVFDHHDLVPELCLSRFGSHRRALHAGAVACEALTFRLADVVISTNESYRAVALGRGHKAPGDVFVVRSAPDTHHFRRVHPDPTLHPGVPHLITYLGVMGPQDGVDHALLALAELRRQRDDWRAVFVGSGDVLDEMRRLAASLGLSDRVTFTGRVPDAHLATILSTASVGICPDPPTPLNLVSTMNKTMEYMAVGLPIAAYDLPETRVSAGGAAVYAKTATPAALAEAVSSILDSPDLRTRMGQIGQARVSGELSWEMSERQLLAAYERAIAIGARRNGRRAGRVRTGERPDSGHPLTRPAAVLNR